MIWTDIYDIAIELEEKHPDVDVISVKFTDLQQWVMELDGFEDEQEKCNEKILEAIQAAWLEERE